MKPLEAAWYEGGPTAWALAPLSWIFCGLVRIRRAAYRSGILRSVRPPVPVIVVGNLTVGGSGKTPLVVWLARFLKNSGFRPGVVSRGYGAEIGPAPRAVTSRSDPMEVGDEPLLIAIRTGCPVVVHPDRAAAVTALMRDFDCDMVISDDGMQHYRLARDIEIAVVDGVRRLGNERCLPAGPLREPVSRLAEVAFVVANGPCRKGEFGMRLAAEEAINLASGERRPLSGFVSETVHAVAGIGFPQRFFVMLRERGLRVLEHPFADHHPFHARELDFADGFPLLLTEKDAVKCRRFANERYWYVPVSAELPPAFGEQILKRLKER